MIRKSLIVCMLLICVCSAFTQNSVADSLNRLLQTEREDTTKAILMSQLSRAYLYSKPDTSLSFAQQGLALSRKINFKKGEVACLRNIGNVFENTGNNPAALEAFLEALKISEEMHDDEGVGRSFSTLSDVYFYEGDFNRSIDYSHKAITIFLQAKDSAILLNTYLNLGDTYEKTNRLDSAMFYTTLGYNMAIGKNNISVIGITQNNFGNIFLKLGKSDSAMLYYSEAIVNQKNTNNDEGLCETYLGIAKIFLQQNNPDSALYYAKLSYTIATHTGFTDKALEASEFLTKYYRSVGNIDSAYGYQQATIAAKDSLFGQQKINQMQNLTYEESVRQQQIEDAKEQERVRAKQNAMLGGLFTLVVVAFLLIRNNRQKRKANTLLQQQKEEIDNKAKELSVQKDNLEQSYNNVERLGDIGRKITASLSVEEIIGTVYNNVNTLMDAAVFGIGIYNDNLKRIEFPTTYENGELLPFYSNSIDDKNRFGPACFVSGKEIIIGDLDKEYKQHIQEVITPHQGSQPVSVIFLPLIAKEKKLGVITVQSFKENAYSDYHLFMLRNIATYTAIAIENAESFETLNETVSRLKSTQSQLVQAEKMASLGELTAGIAHEIQNPLNFVNNFSEVNSEMVDEATEEINKGNIQEVKIILIDIKDNSQKINHHGKRADAIVKSMLQHSKQTRGVKEPADINALSDEYLRLAYHGLRAKEKDFNASIETNFDESIGKINVVPQDIGRVLLNLFNNAFYAVNEKQKVESTTQNTIYKPLVLVSTRKSDDKVEIRVADNGNGVPQNIIDKIFQPFFTTKPTGQGTGLGLSLSYDIIKAHGGEIKVESKDGEGTVLIILLPV